MTAFDAPLTRLERWLCLFLDIAAWINDRKEKHA